MSKNIMLGLSPETWSYFEQVCIWYDHSSAESFENVVCDVFHLG